MNNERRVVTVELTSKRYKGQILIAFGLLFLSGFGACATCVTGFSLAANDGPGGGELLVFGPFFWAAVMFAICIWLVVIGITRWWDHG